MNNYQVLNILQTSDRAIVIATVNGNPVAVVASWLNISGMTPAQFQAYIAPLLLAAAPLVVGAQIIQAQFNGSWSQ